MNHPFFEPRHRELSDRVRAFGDHHLRSGAEGERDPAGRTRELLRQLADAGVLPTAIPAPFGSMDARSIVAVREALAYFALLADAAFATQAQGAYALALAGSDPQKRRWLPALAAGEVAAAFAATEPQAGSDLVSVRARAERDGAAWRISGVKTLVSNALVAGVYTVLARSRDVPNHRGLSLFLVDAGAPGLRVKPLELLAPQPIGEVTFEATPGVLLGEEGRGYALARAALDALRPGIGAAACGLAGRAFDEAVRFALSRRQFGQAIAEFQGVQMALAEMQVDLESARLLVYRAAWTKDAGAERIASEGAAAKLAATEMAQRVVDRALQLHGGQGVLKGATVERLYREVRALRIYDGTSEIQKLVIARQLLRERR